MAKKAESVVYVLSEGMEGGYLPNEVAYFALKGSAESEARERAESASALGFEVQEVDGMFLYHHPDSDPAHRLRTVIKVDAVPRSQLETDETRGMPLIRFVAYLNRQAALG